MKTKLFIISLFTFHYSLFTLAAGETGFYGWRVSGGGNFTFGLKTKGLNVRTANAIGRIPAVPGMGLPGSAADLSAHTPVTEGDRVNYSDDGTYFIDPKSSYYEQAAGKTWNWSLPAAAITQNGDVYSLDYSYGAWGDQTVIEKIRQEQINGGSDEACYGASIQLDRTLWASEDARWGVDAAIGLTWTKANNCYRASSSCCYRRDVSNQSGTYRTYSTDSSFISAGPELQDGTWGGGQYYGMFDEFDELTGRVAPWIDLNKLKTEAVAAGKPEEYSESMSISARGDYEEWEISILVKPWYCLTDWWRVNAAIGLGITRSEFDFAMNAAFNGEQIYSSQQTFEEWRCYGLAGLGTTFRLWRVDLSCDVLARWCQDDMDIDGRDVSGTLEKPNLALRIALGFEF